MTWALLEILVPLVLAFLLGIFSGWLLWRWRRRNVSASEWNQLAANSRSALGEVASVQAAHDEVVNERTILARRVASLESELQSARGAADDSQD